MTPLPKSFLSRPLTHRGYHGAGRPENSRAAFQAAIDAGYGIELDVQLSADDQAMVFHDYDLGRLTGKNGPIRQHGAANLAAIALTGGDEGIPTLPEILALIAGQVPLLIELKDQDGALGPNIGLLEQAVIDAIASYSGPLALMSFNPHSVAVLANLAPDIPRGLTTCHFPAVDWPLVPDSRRAELRLIPDYDRVGASFISHQDSDLDSPHVATCKAKGNVLCWTIKSQAQEDTARKVADNITFEGYAAVCA